MNFEELNVGTVMSHDHFAKAVWVVSKSESKVSCYKIDDTDPKRKERFREFTASKNEWNLKMKNYFECSKTDFFDLIFRGVF